MTERTGAQHLPSHLFGRTDVRTPSRAARTPLQRQNTGDYSAYGTPSRNYDTPTRKSTFGANLRTPSSRRDSLGEPTFDGTPAKFTSVYDAYGMGDDRPSSRAPATPMWAPHTPLRPHPTDPTYEESPRFGEGSFGDSAVDEAGDDHWVTIFGFPPRQTDFILKHFQRYGEIIRHEVEIGQPCNWVHVQYQTRLQAQKALSKNATIIAGGTLMVGVVECVRGTDAPRRKEVNVTTQSRYSASYGSSLFATKTPENKSRSYWSKFSQYVLGY